MSNETWIDVGSERTLKKHPLQQVMLGKTRIALVYKDGGFGAISGTCNHVGGPLGEGCLDGDYVVCPWHYWKFRACTWPCSITQMDPDDQLDRVDDHHRRPGQRAGRGRADAGLFCRDRLPVSAAPLHRALARLECGGHGEQRALRAGIADSARRRW